MQRCAVTLTPELVDLERRQPVALWLDREAETLAQWLCGPILGWRSSRAIGPRAYADGAGHGVPEATQVADRFHLLQNLVEALEYVFHTHRTALDAVNDTRRPQGVPLTDGTIPRNSPDWERCADRRKFSHENASHSSPGSVTPSDRRACGLGR
jgi:transposase